MDVRLDRRFREGFLARRLHVDCRRMRVNADLFKPLSAVTGKSGWTDKPFRIDGQPDAGWTDNAPQGVAAGPACLVRQSRTRVRHCDRARPRSHCACPRIRDGSSEKQLSQW